MACVFLALSMCWGALSCEKRAHTFSAMFATAGLSMCISKAISEFVRFQMFLLVKKWQSIFRQSTVLGLSATFVHGVCMYMRHSYNDRTRDGLGQRRHAMHAHVILRYSSSLELCYEHVYLLCAGLIVCALALGRELVPEVLVCVIRINYKVNVGGSCL